MNTFLRIAVPAFALLPGLPATAHARGDLTVQVQEADRKLLSVGDPAPAVAVGDWVVGKGFGRFEKGKAYVVEFGATWCPPCRASIPHLSELQRKHEGKVAIASVHVWESRGGQEPRAEILAKVADSYKPLDPPVAHAVALDDQNQSMATSWLAAAGLNSIPQAFIVVADDTGPRIAWIGHPLTPQFDEMVQRAADGRIDLKEEMRRAAEEAARRERYERTMGLVQRVTGTGGAGDAPAALAALDEALKDESDPMYRSSYLRAKFNLLAQGDEPAAYAMARGLLEGELKNSEADLAMFCDLVANNAALKTPDGALAVALGERANALSGGKNARTLHSLAGAYAVNGQFQKAIDTEQAAVEAYKAQLGEARAAVMVSMLKARIDEWKKNLPNP
ncbi:MAG: TlpA family protein disulfide reductase [Phycisphaerales bacterium]